MNGLITTAEAAEIMGCSQQWVQSLIKRNKLKAGKFGGVYLLRQGDVEGYEHQPPGRPTEKKRARRRQKKAQPATTNGHGPERVKRKQ